MCVIFEYEHFILFVVSGKSTLSWKFMFWYYILVWAVYLLTFAIEGEILYLLSAKCRALNAHLYSWLSSISLSTIIPHDDTDKADTIVCSKSEH